MVLFGDHDIYGDTTDRLFARFPHSRHVVLREAGHVPWLQNRKAFAAELAGFFDD